MSVVLSVSLCLSQCCSVFFFLSCYTKHCFNVPNIKKILKTKNTFAFVPNIVEKKSLSEIFVKQKTHCATSNIILYIYMYIYYIYALSVFFFFFSPVKV